MSEKIYPYKTHESGQFNYSAEGLQVPLAEVAEPTTFSNDELKALKANRAALQATQLTDARAQLAAVIEAKPQPVKLSAK